jgi:hypothetical protein
MNPEEISEFITETRLDYMLARCGEDGAEYGVCPYITFYIYHTEHDFLDICHEVIDLYQELQTLIDLPFQLVYNTKTEDWVKATPEKLGREMLREHAKLKSWATIADVNGKDVPANKSFEIGATDQESTAASARWAISVCIEGSNWSCYSTVKITFRDLWYRAGNNRQVWHSFVEKWLHRLKPEQCYSGYEIGTTTIGVMGAYESDVMERICADYFYGVDVDHPMQMGYHNYHDKDGYIDYSSISSGLRTPTWCFLLSPIWCNKLGKSIAEVKAALAHPEIHITEIPYPVSKHNPKGEPALWIRLGELSLYSVDEGVPELPMIASALIKPIRCDLLQLYSLAPWEDDPNPRFDDENSPRWMARFDKDSDWPSKEKRFLKPPLEKPKKSEIPPSVPGGKPCPKEGWWWTPAARGESGRRYFKEGEIMLDFKSNYGMVIWQWSGPADDKKH